MQLLADTRKMSDTHKGFEALQVQIATLACSLARVDASIEHIKTPDMILNRRSQPAIGQRQANHVAADVEMLDSPRFSDDILRMKVNQALLELLSYPTMSSRYEAVVEAYPETFEWALRGQSQGQASWSSLSGWLMTGSGVYWICGKAGSGKSTLMKHIFDDAQTRQYLVAWANNSRSSSESPRTEPLCLASFFFWNSGSAEQKSQIGLLRGLLHQILLSIPALIPIAFPAQYATEYSKLVGHKSTELEGASMRWLTSLRQLMAALKGIIKQNSILFKLCLLIDGLDEFDGVYEEMITLFKELAQSPKVKICLSSRPWQVFKENFHECPKLQLQDLTYFDICTYVSCRFQQSKGFQRISRANPSAAHF
jgi:hypothetical protein